MKNFIKIKSNNVLNGLSPSKEDLHEEPVSDAIDERRTSTGL